MTSIHVESCKNALEAIAEGPSHATLQREVHYTVRTALRELDEKDRAALKGWAEAELNTIGTPTQVSAPRDAAGGVERARRLSARGRRVRL
jgi:hypothetical protein